MLPYGRQTIDADDVVAVMNALSSDFLTTGPRVEEFEAAFAEFAEQERSSYAVAVSSGTAALHLAMLALEPKQVVVPSITFLATANAVRYVGAEVAFCDVDPESGLMTTETLMKALEARPNVDGVMPVHLRGDVVEYGVFKVADALGLWVVEDACHALGSGWREPFGGGLARVYSFHPVKTITTGEGGMVTTDSLDLADKIRRLRNHGQVGGKMTELGFNYRLPDINCALGLSQLKKLKMLSFHRLALLARYQKLLAPLAPRVRVATSPEWSQPVPHLMTVLVDHRDAVRERLATRGVGSQVHYRPVHQQPYYVERYGHQHLPGADAYAARCLSLPLFPSMKDEDVDRVVEALACSL